MTKDELLKALERPVGKAEVMKISRFFSITGSLKENLLNFTFNQKDQVAFRAAWVLEYVVLNSPKHPRAFLKKFIAKYPDQLNLSCRRHYTRIMMHLLKDRQSLRGVDLQLVGEATFEWLIDPKNPVAVKANCLDVLLALSRRYLWIREELGMQTEFLMRSGSAAIRVRGKKILRELA